MKLKNKILLLVLAFMFIGLFLTSKVFATDTIDIRVKGSEEYTRAKEILDLVNKERNAVGLDSLRMDYNLQLSAMKRAAEISLDFEHTRPDGSSCNSINSNIYGENIAYNLKGAEDIMNLWMNSEGHRNNILYPNYKSIGIGCFKNGDIYYWVQDFSISETSYELIKTGSQTMTYTIPTLNENLKLYGRKVTNSGSSSFMDVGNKGSYIYGIYNKNSSSVYSVGTINDFTFTSSNSNVIKIYSDGTFNAVGPGNATITIALKNNPSVKYTETITVKVLEPTKITGLKAQNQKTTTLEITWNLQNNTADRYEVYIYNSKTKKYEKLGTISSNVGKVYGIQSGTTYKFKVRALRTVNGKTYYGPYSDVLKTTTATDKTKITKTKGAKKKLTVNWKKISKATGYQVQVATDKKFTKNKKSVTISKNKTISTTIKKLKGKKKYYIRVRTYRKVAGKKVYSSWSSIKNVKTK